MQNFYKIASFFAVLTLGSALAQTAAPQGQSSATAKPKTATTAKPKSATSTAKAVTLTTEKDKISYALGMVVASRLQGQPGELNNDLIVQGLKDELAGKSSLTHEQAQAVLTKWQEDMKKQAEERVKVLAVKDKQQGDAFLAANKAKPGVVTLPDGLQYKIIQPGSGAKPSATDTVSVNYSGKFIDGKEFDSSAKNGGPVTFPVTGVIKGWTEALQLMPVGSKWQLVIPPDLAYGEGGRQGIPPNSTLVFEVELMSIKAGEKPQLQPGADTKTGTPEKK